MMVRPAASAAAEKREDDLELLCSECAFQAAGKGTRNRITHLSDLERKAEFERINKITQRSTVCCTSRSVIVVGTLLDEMGTRVSMDCIVCLQQAVHKIEV